MEEESEQPEQPARPRRDWRVGKEWWDEHPEERERASKRAKELVAAGKLSGAAGFGVARKRPAYEISAVKAAVNAERLANELIDQALNAESIPQRQKAIEILFAAEHRVRQERRDEQDALARLVGDELTQELLRTLRDLTGLEAFDDAIDSTAEEIDDEEGGENGYHAAPEVETDEEI